MSNIIELNTNDIDVVCGAEQTIAEQLEDRFPGGVWIGNSFFPNGVPSWLD